jgi:predicted site-specific integrase-resolvase
MSVAVYARVSAAENRPDLERQADRLMAYCSAKGYQITQVVKAVGCGVNDGRPRFRRLLAGQVRDLLYFACLADGRCLSLSGVEVVDLLFSRFSRFCVV